MTALNNLPTPSKPAAFLLPKNSAIRKVAAVLSYALSSLLIILFNKQILSIYHFPAKIFLTLVHMITCLVGTSLLKRHKIVDFPDPTVEIVTAFAPLSIFYVFNIVIGMIALSVVNVPMFTTLRRLTTVFIIPLDYFLLKKVPNPKEVGSVLILITGALVAGSGDLSFDVKNYSFVILNNLCTSLYLIFIKRMDKNIELNMWGKTFFNAFISIPFLIFFCAITGEFHLVWNFEYITDLKFLVALLISCGFAFGVNGATFWCTTETDALTTSVTGQCKNIIVTFLGMFIFGDVEVNPLLVSGLTLGVVGSVAFSYVKTQQKRSVEYEKLPKQTELENITVSEAKNMKMN